MNREGKHFIFTNAVKKLSLKNNDIVEKTGYPKDRVSKFLSNKESIPDKFLQKFSESFEIDINIKPEPQNNDQTVNKTQTEMNFQVINQLSNIIVEKDKEIEALKRELKECIESERVSPL